MLTLRDDKQFPGGSLKHMAGRAPHVGHAWGLPGRYDEYNEYMHFVDVLIPRAL